MVNAKWWSDGIQWRGSAGLSGGRQGPRPPLGCAGCCAGATRNGRWKCGPPIGGSLHVRDRGACTGPSQWTSRASERPRTSGCGCFCCSRRRRRRRRRCPQGHGRGAREAPRVNCGWVRRKRRAPIAAWGVQGAVEVHRGTGPERSSPYRPCTGPYDSFARDRGISPQTVNHEPHREHFVFGFCPGGRCRALTISLRNHDAERIRSRRRLTAARQATMWEGVTGTARSGGAREGGAGQARGWGLSPVGSEAWVKIPRASPREGMRSSRGTCRGGRQGASKWLRMIRPRTRGCGSGGARRAGPRSGVPATEGGPPNRSRTLPNHAKPFRRSGRPTSGRASPRAAAAPRGSRCPAPCSSADGTGSRSAALRGSARHP